MTEDTFKLLLLTLFLSLLSSILAIFVAIKDHNENKIIYAEKGHTQQMIQTELKELHKEIAWIKQSK